MTLPAKPHFDGYEWVQRNGDELADAMGTVAGSYFVAGLKVVGARSQGWTACTGAAAGGTNKGGINGTSTAGSFLTTDAASLSTACLALATLVYEGRKTICSLQAAMEAHGSIGTTIS